MQPDGMRIAMLISGGGTTAAAILDACKSGELRGVVSACVIASTPEAGGILRLKEHGMAAENIHVLQPSAFGSGEEFGDALLTILKEHGVDFVGQYGWLAKTPATVVRAFEGMMTNQHPGPLDPPHPDFGGAGMFGRRVHAARILFVRKVNRDFWSEATVQRVGVEFDAGKVIDIRRAPILPEDDVPALQARILPLEHELQIATLQKFAENKVVEYVRPERLVRPGEEEMLKECKMEAKKMYPDG